MADDYRVRSRGAGQRRREGDAAVPRAGAAQGR
jgi:hypothetical protein